MDVPLNPGAGHRASAPPNWGLAGRGPDRLLAAILGGRVPAARRVATAVAAFCLVVSVRLLLIGQYAVALPYSDQWDSDGWDWLRPWKLGGGFDWSMLFAAHNEHRIALVRLVSLALFALNQQQWDNLVGVTLDAVLVGVAVALAVRALVRERIHGNALIVLALVCVACLPNGFENTLVAFQLQVYLLAGLAVLGAWLVASHTTGLKLALACAAVLAASLFSMASGVVTAAAMLFGLLLRRRAGTAWSMIAPALLICSAAMVAAWLMRVTVPGHESLHARTPSEWFAGVVVLGSWPLSAHWPLLLLIWMPALVATARAWRMPQTVAGDRCAIILAAWGAMQVAVIGFGRARDLEAIASRYTDVLAVGVLANAYLAARLSCEEHGVRHWKLRAGAAWILTVAGAIAIQNGIASIAMHDFAVARKNQSDYVRLYVRGNDASKLLHAEPWNLPYPDRNRLRMMLDDPTIRQMLPASVRPQVAFAFHDGFDTRSPAPAHNFELPAPPPFGFDPAYGTLITAPFRRETAGSAMSYLRFEAAGEFRANAVAVGLAAPREAPVWYPLQPAATPQPHEVRSPGPAFTFEVKSDQPSARFVVAAPVEVGRLSHAVDTLLGAASWFAIAAAAFALLTIVRIVRAWILNVRGASTGET